MTGTQMALVFGLATVGGYWIRGMWCKKCQGNNTNGR